MIWQNKGHEFDEIGSKIKDRTTAYYLWGAGKICKKFIAEYGEEIQILGLIDKNEARQGEEYCGYPIYAPSVLEKEPDSLVIITVMYGHNEIFQELTQYQRRKHESAFNYVFFPDYLSFYRENRLVMKRVAMIITDYCALKCDGCGALNPLITDRKHKTVEEILDSFQSLFKHIDAVKSVALSGGDAFCHPLLPTIISCLLEKYDETKVEHIEIFTCGVIVPSDELVSVLNKYRARVEIHISDYEEEASSLQKIPQVVAKFSETDILFQALPTTWVDYGFHQKTNHIPEEKLPDFFERCVNLDCITLQENKLYLCSLSCSPIRLNMVKETSTDFLDLRIPLPKAEMFEFLHGYSEIGYLSICKKCNGGRTVNSLVIPAGKQLP